MDVSNAHIAILAGGVSAEREVSLASGKAVKQACDTLGLNATLVDVDYTIAAELQTLKPDVAFVALHGTMGEDGAIQGLLEWLRIPYTHSGVTACALAMEKRVAKHIVAQAAVPVLDDQRILSADDITLPLPYVIKPIADGSSVGVHVVHTKEEANNLPDFTAPMMAEPFFSGIELTVGVLGNDVLDVIEIRPQDGMYDYAHKYTAGLTDYIIPAKIPESITNAIQTHGLQAHRALGCKDISRSDFLYNPDTNALIYLETNTHPGFTSTSLLPKMAAHRGQSFEEMVLFLLEHASLGY